MLILNEFIEGSIKHFSCSERVINIGSRTEFGPDLFKMKMYIINYTVFQLQVYFVFQITLKERFLNLGFALKHF